MALNTEEQKRELQHKKRSVDFAESFSSEVNLENSLENVQVAKKLKLSRKAPAITLNMSSILKNLKPKSNHPDIPEEDDAHREIENYSPSSVTDDPVESSAPENVEIPVDRSPRSKRASVSREVEKKDTPLDSSPGSKSASESHVDEKGEMPVNRSLRSKIVSESLEGKKENKPVDKSPRSTKSLELQDDEKESMPVNRSLRSKRVSESQEVGKEEIPVYRSPVPLRS